MENLKSKKYNYNEVIKMPSVEEQKELKLINCRIQILVLLISVFFT